MTIRRLTPLLLAAALVAGWASSPEAMTRRTFDLFPAGVDDTTAVGMADSTAYVPTHQYQRMRLWLKPSRPCRVAISVYEATVSDTDAVVRPDTAKVAIWPWRGGAEAAAGADSLSFRETLAPTSDQAASYEMVYEFPAAAAGKWGSPRGRSIFLRGVDGTWYSGDYTRIRVRVLSASGVVTWEGYLKGQAW
jgi:hypothetical protein